MLARTRTALKFMTYGIIVGLFFAPRPGAETRKQVMDWVGTMTKDLFGGRDNSMSRT